MLSPPDSGEAVADIARAIAENATVGLFMVGAEGLCTYVNPAAERMTGFTASELLGRSLHERLHHTNRDGTPNPKETCPLDLSLASAQPVREHATVFVRRDGSFFDVLCAASPIVEGGRRTGTVIEVRDVTDEARAQVALQQSEERYRLIARAANDAIWDWDVTTGTLHWNEGVEKLFGYSLEEIPATLDWWTEHVHEEDRERVMKSLHEAIERGDETWSSEYRFVRKNGQLAAVIDRGVVARDAGGNAVRMVGAMLDITERRRHEDALRLHSLVLSNMSEGVSLSDERGYIVYTNAAEDAMFGYEPGELVGQHVTVLNAYPPAENEQIVAEVIAHLRERGAWDGEWVNCRKDGTTFITSSRITALEIGGRPHWVCVQKDITEQKRAREEADYQSRLNRTITDNAASCLFMMDERGHPTFMNPAAEQVTGYTLDEIRHAPLHFAVHHHHPDGRPYPIEECPIDNGREQLVPLQDYRDVFVRKDGTFFPVSCYVAPLVERGGRNYAVLEFRDISDELRAQEALREADRRKDEFLATLSHELRTPLTAILGWSRLLQLGASDEATLRTGIDTIEKSARVQAQIVDDVLDLSRIISGKIHVETSTVNVARVVESALEGIRLAAEAKQIAVTSSFPEVEPLILGDANRLQQVIWNLLTNAIKFTPAGGSVSATVGIDDGNVVIRVSDSGIGIRPDFLPHVFDTFRQAEAASTRSHGGLGLGLSIVRHLVQLHGGTVMALSDGEGKGATFIIELPRLRRTSLTTTSTLAEDDSLADLTGVSALVIDDQQAVRDYMAAVLRKCGAGVRHAANVEEAIWLVQDALPDVIVCDIAMPHADGYAFIEWLRSIPWPRRVPVVAVTAFGRTEDREQALAAGFDAYVRKPIQPGELSRAVEGVRG